MKRLMKAELYKFGHEKSVWIISAVLIACACISIFTQVYPNAENAFTNLGKDVMVLYLACAIYAGVSLADEFSNRTIIHIIAHGYSRMQFLMAKLIHYLLGCLLNYTCLFNHIYRNCSGGFRNKYPCLGFYRSHII